MLVNTTTKLGFVFAAATMLAACGDLPTETAAPTETALHKAAVEGNTELAKQLLDEGANPNAKNADGQTPLHPTAWFGHADTAKVLLAAGANPDIQDKMGYAPLHTAVLRKATAVVAVLLEEGANPNAKQEQEFSFGWRPLHLAVPTFTGDGSQADLDIALLLLAAGADPNGKDKEEQTPLHKSARGGNIALTRVFLRNGANVNARDNFEHTPLDLAVSMAAVEPSDAREAMLDLLILNGAKRGPDFL